MCWPATAGMPANSSDDADSSTGCSRMSVRFFVRSYATIATGNTATKRSSDGSFPPIKLLGSHTRGLWLLFVVAHCLVACRCRLCVIVFLVKRTPTLLSQTSSSFQLRSLTGTSRPRTAHEKPKMAKMRRMTQRERERESEQMGSKYKHHFN